MIMKKNYQINFQYKKNLKNQFNLLLIQILMKIRILHHNYNHFNNQFNNLQNNQNLKKNNFKV